VFGESEDAREIVIDLLAHLWDPGNKGLETLIQALEYAMHPSSAALAALKRIWHDEENDKGHDVVEAFRAAVYDSLVDDARTATDLAAKSKRILDDCVLANGGYENRALLVSSIEFNLRKRGGGDHSQGDFPQQGALEHPFSYLAVASAAALGLPARARVEHEDDEYDDV